MKTTYLRTVFAITATLAIAGLSGFHCADGGSPEPQDSGHCDQDGGVVVTTAPVLVVENARVQPFVQDFSRLLFMKVEDTPTDTLGLPANSRVFMAPSYYFSPPLPVKDIPQYPGLSYSETKKMAVIRCKPASAGSLDARLATWTGVFEIIKTDFSGKTCPASEGDAEAAIYCMVKDFVDTPVASASASVKKVFDIAAAFFDTRATSDVLKTRYGIYQEFSGLGYAVKVYGNYDPMPAEIVLRNSIVPEYTVKNAKLIDANCRCISVPPYEGRGDQPLDMNMVWDKGSASCPVVEKLR